MNLPKGTGADVIINPAKEGIFQYLMGLMGALIIESGDSGGFILTRNGEIISAYYQDKDGNYRGKSAIDHLMTAQGSESSKPQTFAMRTYGEDDFNEALTLSTRENLLLNDAIKESTETSLTSIGAEIPRGVPAYPDPATMTKIISQPGVIAVSAFYEGFPVQSLGNEDFEHVAARAEDLLRAGTRIAQDMSLGDLDQLTLETRENKIIIAPFGDLFICIIARADAQLGLLRVLLRSIQSDAAGATR